METVMYYTMNLVAGTIIAVGYYVELSAVF